MSENAQRESNDPPADGSPASVAVPIPAATVVLLRPTPHGPEVLLTRRPATMVFGPDIHVFPGGRVDAADHAGPARQGPGLTEDEAARRLGAGIAPDPGMTPASALAHHVAAVRETAEETGIQISASQLIALTRWVTPVSMARRFDVRFFAALVPSGTDVVAASAEVVDAVWLRPAEALEAAASGRIEVWQPTFVTLQQLDGLTNEAAVRAAFAAGSQPGGPTFELVEPGIVRVEGPWAGGIPGRRATGWLVGRDEIVVVDPCDPTGVSTEAVLGRLRTLGGRLAGVVVRDLAPEHHAGVEMFAHGLRLPVCVPSALAGVAPYAATGLAPGEPVPFGDVPITLDALARLPSS